MASTSAYSITALNTVWNTVLNGAKARKALPFGWPGAARMMSLFIALVLCPPLLSGCGDDETAAEKQAKAPPVVKPAPVAVKFGPYSIDNILRDIMLLKMDDHDGMQQVVRNNAAGYCTEGKHGVGINQLPVETAASESRKDQSYDFAMKDALQDAMHPLKGRYRPHQVKQLYTGLVRWNGQTFIRTIVMGCFVQLSTSNK